MNISPVHFNASSLQKRPPQAPLFGQNPKDGSRGDDGQNGTGEISTGRSLLTLFGILLATGTFIVGGIKATDAMNDDGSFFNVPSTTERNYIRSKTDDPWLGLGMIGGILMTVVGLRGSKKEEGESEGKADKP